MNLENRENTAMVSTVELEKILINILEQKDRLDSNLQKKAEEAKKDCPWRLDPSTGEILREPMMLIPENPNSADNKNYELSPRLLEQYPGERLARNTTLRSIIRNQYPEI